MKKSLINEINDMKYLFGYKRGVVISEQDVAEPEVAPDTDIDVKPSRPTRPNPFNPDRAKEFNPFPDLEPQGEEDDEFYMSDTEVLEPEVAPDIEREVAPSRPTRPNPFNPDRAKEFNPFPDLEPQGKMDDEQNEPFVDDPEVDYDENRSLEDLVAKYLGNK
jgi:hypothetical protein